MKREFGRRAGPRPSGSTGPSYDATPHHFPPSHERTLSSIAVSQVNFSDVLGDVRRYKKKVYSDGAEEAMRRAAMLIRVENTIMVAFLLGICATHFIAFREGTRVPFAGKEREPIVQVTISLGIGFTIWLGMLLPALSTALEKGTQREKREADRKNAQNAEKTHRERQQGNQQEKLQQNGQLFVRLVRYTVHLGNSLHDTPNYWVARLVRLFVYCGFYLTSTYYLTEREPVTGVWVMGPDQIPETFFVINFISIWTTFFDYALELLSGGWDFVFSVASIVELVTQPPLIWIVTNGLRALKRARFGPSGSTFGELWQLDRLSDDPTFYLIQFGWLRFLSLHRVNVTALSKVSVMSARLRVGSLAIGVTCILFIIAGVMFTLEARLTTDETFVNFFDFLYFAVVTGSTVGYGDFAPTTPLSRLTCVLAIIATIVWIPEQISELNRAFNEAAKTWGTKPRTNEPFVLLCGNVTPWQLRIFFRNYLRFQKAEQTMRRKPPRKLVVLSEIGIAQYGVDKLGRVAQSHIYLYNGDLLTSLELGTRDTPLKLHMASDAFVYGGEGEDSEAMLRVMALLNFIPPFNISILLSRTQGSTIASKMGMQNVLCLRDLQMRWLAKSITDTPGIVCLMANLLVSAAEFEVKDRRHAYFLGDEANDMLTEKANDMVTEVLADKAELHRRTALPSRGAVNGHMDYNVLNRTAPREAPPPHIGKKSALEATATRSGSRRASIMTQGGSFYARSDSSRRNMFGTLRTVTATEYDDDRGAYLLGAESQLFVHRLPAWAWNEENGRTDNTADRLYRRVALEEGIQLLAVRDGDNMYIWQPKMSLTKEMDGIWIARSEKHLRRFVSSSTAEPRAPRAKDMSDVPRVTGTERGYLEKGDRVLVIGAPADVELLLGLILDRTRPASSLLRVVHIAAAPYSGLETTRAALNKAWPRGPGKEPAYVFEVTDPLDHRVLRRHLLAPGLNSVLIFPEQLRPGAPGRTDSPSVATTVTSMLPPSSRVPVYVSLSSTAEMRFIERSSWWPGSDDAVSGHITSPTYASGMVYAAEMLFPLMGWTKDGLIPFLRGLADNVLDPVEIKLLDLPPALRRRAVPMSKPTLEDITLATHYPPADQSASGRARSAPRPLGRRGSIPAGTRAPDDGFLSYGELRRFLYAEGILTIGLYRERTAPLRAGSLHTELGALPFVFTNPPNTTRVRESDRVFALIRPRQPKPKHHPNAQHQPKSTHRKPLTTNRIEDAALSIQLVVRKHFQAKWEQNRKEEILRSGALEDPAENGNSLYATLLGFRIPGLQNFAAARPQPQASQSAPGSPQGGRC